MSRNFLFIIAASVLALVLAGGWYWLKNRVEPVETTEEAIEVLKETPLQEAVAPTNPLIDKVPELNPVDKVNPFKDGYKNPFAP